MRESIIIGNQKTSDKTEGVQETLLKGRSREELDF